jgi:hypothetical protein
VSNRVHPIDVSSCSCRVRVSGVGWGAAHLASDGAGEEGLAGAGRALEDEAAGNARAEGREAVRLLEELHHLLQLLLAPRPLSSHSIKQSSIVDTC